MRRAFDYEVEGQRGQRKPSRRWKKQVEEECMNTGLSMEGHLTFQSWIVGINQIATSLRLVRPPTLGWNMSLVTICQTLVYLYYPSICYYFHVGYFTFAFHLFFIF